MCWHTSEKDNLLGAVALIRAFEIASLLQINMTLVDPDNLWASLSQAVAP